MTITFPKHSQIATFTGTEHSKTGPEEPSTIKPNYKNFKSILSTKMVPEPTTGLSKKS